MCDATEEVVGGRVCLGQRMLGMCLNPCETLTEWRTKCLAGFNSCVLQLRVTVLGMHTYNGRHERMGFLDWLRSASSGRGHTWKLVSKRRSQKVVPRLLIACACCSGRICTQVHAGQGWSIFLLVARLLFLGVRAPGGCSSSNA